MSDEQFGHRDRRGYWHPLDRIEYPPAFVWPLQPVRFAKWFLGIPGYIFPWNALYFALALFFWVYLTPPIEALREFSVGWVAYLLARNAVLILLFVGAWHLRLYVQKSQSIRFKFNQNWPPTKNSAFLFKSQTLDNMIWTFASAVPIWTAYEAVALWSFANGYIPWLQWSQNPVYFVLLALLIPVLRDIHFYVIHRLIHWPPLYRLAHSLHHKNINPGPWSGLAMHPLEHVLYFSGVLVHFVLASHPVHALFHLMHAALSPAQGHVGFDRMMLGEESSVNTHSYAHYLHHRYFNCNYADGTVPLDKWFGTFHDGSKEAQQRLQVRLRDK